MLYLCYLCRFKPLRDHLRGFLIAAWAGDKIAEFSFPEISFYFPLRPWFFFVSPAYAGKSPARFSSPRRCRDHPRMCGEKGGRRDQHQPELGSPPRMRGKGHRDGQAGVLGGITPVYAGKRSPDLPARPSGWDHPRMCGEKPTLRCPCLPYRGSPPRMRGKGIVNVFVSEKLRITPACAGKSWSNALPCSRREDHPPHVRGKACRRSPQPSGCGDHPRMCGEKTFGLKA